MKEEDIKQKIQTIPEGPGVYLFTDRTGAVLYVGKATSLKSRVRSYFSGDIAEKRSAWIARMIEKIRDIEVRETDSVLEAVLLEPQLIKRYQPPFNSREKDNKSFTYVVITDEQFPRVVTVRERELTKTAVGPVRYAFGPFPQGRLLKDALRLIRGIFPFRDARCVPAEEQKRTPPRACFYRSLGLCPGVCTGEITSAQYRRHIQHIRLFFEGKKGQVISRLRRDMMAASECHDFERAREIRDRISSLEHIRDISLITDSFFGRDSGTDGYRIEGYDIAHTAGTSVVGVMVVSEGGEMKKGEYRTFRIKDRPGINDTKALKEIVSRRLSHSEWRMPDCVVVDGGVAQKNAVEAALSEGGCSVPVIAVVKDKRHRPHRYLGDRSLVTDHKTGIVEVMTEAHRFALSYHRKLRGRLRT